VAIAGRMVERFVDPDGGFFTTPENTPGMIASIKSGYDGATPSGNSVATMTLLRLARYTGRSELERTAVATIRRFYPLMVQHPSAFSNMLMALDYLLHPGSQLALFLPDDSPASDALQAWERDNPDPYRTTVVVRGTEAGSTERDLLPLVESRSALDGRPTAYFCRGLNCLPPAHSPEELDRLVVSPGDAPA
jgi:uncharacterized protein YyaL (SSP411 family)